jgi:uncharacterized protein (DUF1697 family)
VARHVVLLRGINLGPRNRIPMPELRDVLAGAGFDDVRTYVQSGNVVVGSSSRAERVARDVERVIADRFGLEIPAIVRTRAELAKVVQRNPLARVATDPKRYQVSFLAARPPRGLEAKLAALAAEQEAFEVSGREVYAWHPAGVARSKLWAYLASTRLGVPATARNWTTVTRLLELAAE